MGLTLNDRTIIAEHWEAGDSATDIAKGLDFATSTIYAELARGNTGELDRSFRPRYDAEQGQAAYQASLRNRGNRKQRRKATATSKGAKKN